MIYWSPDTYHEPNLPSKRRQKALQRSIAAKYALHRSNSFNSLRRLPPEVRITIWKMSMALVDQSPLEGDSFKQSLAVIREQPAILIALRPDSNMYSESLQIFYDVNALRLHGSTFGRLRCFSTATLQLIKNVSIEAK